MKISKWIRGEEKEHFRTVIMGTLRTGKVSCGKESGENYLEMQAAAGSCRDFRPNKRLQFLLR